MVKEMMQTKLTHTLAVGTASLGLVAGLGFVGFGAANAATLSYSFTNPLENTEINQTSALTKFDPSLGTLTQAKLTLSGQARQTFAAKNTVDTIQNADISAATQMTFALSDGITLSDPNNGNPAFSLQTSTGAFAYQPFEEKSFGPYFPTASAQYLFPPNSSLDKFLSAAGDTSFDVTCTSLSALLVIGGGGNVTASQATTAGCSGLVEYTYTPAPPPQNIPEPSAVFGLGVFGLGALLKRNKEQYSNKA